MPPGYPWTVSSDPLELKETFQAEYRARWEAVETARAQELASMTEDRARQIIQSLRPFAPLPPNPANGMDLLGQQLGLLEAGIELSRDLRARRASRCRSRATASRCNCHPSAAVAASPSPSVNHAGA
jgi:hypothetical protein